MAFWMEVLKNCSYTLLTTYFVLFHPLNMSCLVKFASQIYHENVNISPDGAFLFDFEIDVGRSNSSCLKNSIFAQ